MKKNGFIMFYAVIMVGVMAAAASAILRSTRTESSISSSSAESTAASLAADAGIECVRYWQLSQEAPGGGKTFSPNAPISSVDIDCRVDSAGGSLVTIQHPYTGNQHCLGSIVATEFAHPTFTVGPFTPNGPCAHVTITVTQTNVSGTSYCDFSIISRGLNNCTEPSVERVLWETL